MLAVLSGFFTRNALAIAGWAAAAFAVLAVLFGAREAGKQAERVKQLKKEKEHQDEMLRQNRIVLRGNVERMRKRLSDALKRKRNP